MSYTRDELEAMKVAQLKEIAKSLPGFKSRMRKAEYVNLILSEGEEPEEGPEMPIVTKKKTPSRKKTTPSRKKTTPSRKKTTPRRKKTTPSRKKTTSKKPTPTVRPPTKKGKEKGFSEDELKAMKLADLRELTKNISGYDPKKRTKKFYIDLYSKPVEKVSVEKVSVEIVEGDELVSGDFGVSNFVIIGDLETAFKFIKPMTSVEDFVSGMPERGKEEGYARLELDPLCEGDQCGSHSVVINVDADDPNLTMRKDLGDAGFRITLGDPLMDRSTLVDFFVGDWLVIGDLIGFMNVVEAFDRYEQLEERVGGDGRYFDEVNGVFLFNNFSKSPILMDLDTPPEESGAYTSFNINVPKF